MSTSYGSRTAKMGRQMHMLDGWSDVNDFESDAWKPDPRMYCRFQLARCSVIALGCIYSLRQAAKIRSLIMR